MCDVHAFQRKGWKGWPRFEVQAPASAQRVQGPWIDLSHVLDAQDAWPPVFPKPRFSRISSMPEHPLNTTEMQMVCHVGTHIDAPSHILQDGPSFEQVPLDRLHGAGVVWRIRAVATARLIDVADLQRARPCLRPGDIVFIDTDWASHWGSVHYFGDDHMSLTVAAAQWLVDQGIKALGVDVPTPDLPLGHRPEGFDWPVHKVLLGNGRLVIENLANLRPLANQRVEVMAHALNIRGSDGAPARILARRVDDAPAQ